jgi:hypothetical protein
MSLRAPDGKAIACTVDEWTSRRGRKFIAVTGHWLDDGWRMCSCVLGIAEVMGASTAATLQGYIEDIVGRFSDKFFVSTLTHDGASNIVRAAEDFLGLSAGDSQRCFAHALDLLIGDLLSSIPELGRIIALVRTLISRIRSSALKKRLQEHCRARGLLHTTLILPCKTRWCGTFYMIERLLELWQCVVSVIENAGSERDLPSLGDDDLDWLQSLQEVLRPLEKVIRQCEGEKYVTCAYIPYWAAQLKDAFSRKARPLTPFDHFPSLIPLLATSCSFPSVSRVQLWQHVLLLYTCFPLRPQRAHMLPERGAREEKENTISSQRSHCFQSGSLPESLR